MRLRSILAAALGLTIAAGVHAAPLTPEQALQAVRNSAASPRRIKGQPMKLSYTYERNQTPVLYIFTAENPDAEGYIVASADDRSVPLLGYSDSGVFNPDKMPPQMRNWLACYGPKQTAPRASHAAISPLCSTTWDQDAPYYNECPKVANKQCYTGCVATAMAQVMKVQQWPATGTGSHSYSWKSDYDNKTYTDSFNFGATTFNWSQMKNSYTGNYTTAQGNAVAKLMHACGVAADMNYGPDGSGAMEYEAAAGMINYLGYDAGTAVMNRSWYTTDGWDTLVYNELAAGRAVMYCGANSNNEGHAFVCDGYNGSGYYHFNWGWSGTYDGYFLLANPDPEGTGIGGGSGSSGFKYEMTALVGAKPAVEGSVRPILLDGAKITTDKSSYNRNSSTNIKVNSTGSFCCLSTSTFTGNVGFVITGDNIAPTYIAGEDVELQLYYGMSYYLVPTSSLPVGTWKAFPAATEDGGQTWNLIKFDPSLCKGYFNVTVTSSKVTVSAGTEDIVGPEPSQEPEPAEIVVDWTGKSPNDEYLYMGDTYALTFSYESEAGFEADYKAVLYDTQAVGEVIPEPVTEGFESAESFATTVEGWTFVDKDGQSVGSPQSVDIPGITSGSTTGSWWVCDASQLDSSYFAAHNGSKHIFNMYNLNGQQNSDWVISPELSGKAQTVSFYAKSYTSQYGNEQFKVYTSTESVNPTDFTLLAGPVSVPDDWTLYQYNVPAGAKRFAIECCSEDVFMLFVDDITYTPAPVVSTYLEPIAETALMHATSSDGTKVYGTANLTIPTGLDTNTPGRYELHLCKVENGESTSVRNWTANIVKKASVVDALSEEEGTPLYFDLMGRRIANPQPGNIYIVRTTKGVAKVVM